ncbi:hypothetical protein SISSUDRAFT_468697 [Sistotremastrum suecicum HHB10207 ss-3]|uniref:Uncharacterized protein n=1 Tax=Sistotremastrum suecicum HHB10207 ss-3 TaxID=1314776 RepID=A0A165Y671_9AGAM|nr:hypothetical protein SISSUDRAFT_468697 [Sistotremastrum suecicum HHB10207 ss-3]
MVFGRRSVGSSRSVWLCLVRCFPSVRTVLVFTLYSLAIFIASEFLSHPPTLLVHQSGEVWRAHPPGESTAPPSLAPQESRALPKSSLPPTTGWYTHIIYILVTRHIARSLRRRSFNLSSPCLHMDNGPRRVLASGCDVVAGNLAPRRLGGLAVSSAACSGC